MSQQITKHVYNLLIDLLEDGHLLGGGLGPGLPAPASGLRLASRVAATAATWRPGLALRRLLQGVVIVLGSRQGQGGIKLRIISNFNLELSLKLVLRGSEDEGKPAQNLQTRKIINLERPYEYQMCVLIYI